MMHEHCKMMDIAWSILENYFDENLLIQSMIMLMHFVRFGLLEILELDQDNVWAFQLVDQSFFLVGIPIRKLFDCLIIEIH